ncbi:hypothetical protein FA13DRAFT_1802485 [Coprinellus micaceus]|uniref:Uncharacterized protein n=1 Tax=Coprinellus micaceus TaxID=71717 RepID=A0A4Y7SCC5_COPMI|nr:hypothetical protein FA13DRAFT_1806937 [Coprinellus micaceus]TEB09005.1 hypothetical protein FA13DRAFT_1806810 [Coprinellus micaceus]TEB19274.1 hypothetical protein FA13DRAFT_1802485 [Coprinellus micaceus]
MFEDGWSNECLWADTEQLPIGSSGKGKKGRAMPCAIPCSYHTTSHRKQGPGDLSSRKVFLGAENTKKTSLRIEPRSTKKRD